MGGCKSSILSQLLKTYSLNTLMDYATSMIGTQFLGQQFGNLKNMITQKFNSLNTLPDFGTKMFEFDKIIKNVTSNQQEQMTKMNQLKPYIRQLDDGPAKNKTQFMNVITNQYPQKINSFKQNLLKELGDKINPLTYLKGFV